MIKSVAAAATVASLLAVAPPAHAERHDADSRPCVSQFEFNHAGTISHRKRAYLETRWEVRGLGHRVASPEALPFADMDASVGEDPPGSLIYQYQACGYSSSEAGVYVHYSAHGHRWFRMDYWLPVGATLHGRPRAVALTSRGGVGVPARVVTQRH